MSRRLTTRVEGWVNEGIDQFGLADKDTISFEIQTTLSQNGGIQMAVIMFMPSGIIGMLVSSFTLIQNPPMITEQEVIDITAQGIEGLRNARSEALADSGGGEVIDGQVD